MTDKPDPAPEPDNIPALFATIHFRGPARPEGYTGDDIAELNALANAPKELK